MAPFSNDRLNFFKFCIVVLEKFPLALQQVFVLLWNNSEGWSLPKWDDTDEVRNIFLKEEDWETNVPTRYSIKEWNSAVLFQATLYAKMFGKIDGNGRRRTLKQLYVKREPSRGAFHPRIGKGFRSQSETFALALDQLRLLRNALCYLTKEQEVDNERLDMYLGRAKEAFAALDQDNTMLDNVEKLTIHYFSTEKCQWLVQKLTRETEAAIKFNQMEDLNAGDEKPHKRVVVADLQDVKAGSKNTKAKKEEKGFVAKEVQTASPEKVTVGKSGNNEVADLNMTMDHSEPERGDNKMEMSDVQTRNDDRNSCPDVKTLETKEDSDTSVLTKGKTCCLSDIQRKDKVTSTKTLGAYTKTECKRKQILDAKKAMNDGTAFSNEKQEKMPFTGEDDASMLRYCQKKLNDGRLDINNQNVESGAVNDNQSLNVHHTNKETSSLLSDENGLNVVQTNVKMFDIPRELGSDQTDVENVLPEKKEKWEDDVAHQETKTRAMTRNIGSFVSRVQTDRSDAGNVKQGTADTRNACPIGFKNAYPLAPSDVLAEVRSVDQKTKDEVDKKKKVETTEPSCIKRDVKSMAKYFEANLNNQTQDANGKASSSGGKNPEKGASVFKTRTERAGSDSNHGGIRVTKRQKIFEPDVSNVSSGVSSIKTNVEDVDPKLKDLKTERDGLLPPDVNKKGKTVNPAVASDCQNQHTSQEELKGSSMCSQHTESNTLQSFGTVCTSEASFFDLACTLLTISDKTSEDHQVASNEDTNVVTASDKKCMAYSYHNIGVKQMDMNDLDGALVSLKKARQLSGEPSPDDSQPASTLVVLGVVYLKKGDNRLAVASFQSALDMLLNSIKDRKQAAIVYFLLGIAQRVNKDINSALESLQFASQLQKELLGDAPDTARSFQELGTVCSQLSNNSSAIAAYQEAADIRAKVLGDHESTAFSFQCLGNAQFRSKDCSAAMISFQRASDMYRKIKGDHIETAESFRNLGHVSLQAEDYTSAIEALQVAAEMNSNVLGDHQDTADSYFDLATAQMKVANCNKAIAAFQEAAEIRAKVLGDHESTALSLQCLGNAQRRSKDYSAAMISFQRASDMYRKIKGDHIETAKSFHNLGHVSLLAEDNTSAIEALQVAAEMRSGVLGDHEDTAHSFHLLGLAQCSEKDFCTALSSFQKSTRIFDTIKGDHIDTARSFQRLGHVCDELGDDTSAIKAFQKAADIRSKVLGDHDDTARSFTFLGSAQFRNGDHTKALNSFERASKMNEKINGDHIKTAASFHSLGEVYLAMGNETAAVGPLQKAAKMRFSLLGDHIETAESYHMLGLAQQETGDLSGSLESLIKASQLMQEFLGDHSMTAASFDSLARVYIKINDKNSAVEALRVLAQMNSKVHGEHKSTAWSYYSLGALLFEKGDLQEAEEALKEASQLIKKLLGDSHPDSIKSVQLLNDVHIALAAPKHP